MSYCHITRFDQHSSDELAVRGPSRHTTLLKPMPVRVIRLPDGIRWRPDPTTGPGRMPKVVVRHLAAGKYWPSGPTTDPGHMPRAVVRHPAVGKYWPSGPTTRRPRSRPCSPQASRSPRPPLTRTPPWLPEPDGERTSSLQASPRNFPFIEPSSGIEVKTFMAARASD